MIKSLEIKNFRSFENLTLADLPTVNLLVGKSAAGKTSLLEAIRLALGATPQVAWQLNAVRGIAFGIPPNPTREQFEAAWKPYFFDFDITKVISFKVTDSEQQIATAKIYFDTNRPVAPLLLGIQVPPGYPTLTNTIIPLAFERKSFSGEASVLDASINPQQHGQFFLQQGAELGTVSEFFPSTWQSNSQQVATWYSQLRIAGSVGDLPAIVGRQFPEISDISPEIPFGIGALYATVKHRSEKMPLSLVSSGINKFISLLIAIRTYRGGVVLIDEIENGIYFKMFPALWDSLYKFAHDNKTQLFVSTHSWECLKGATGIIDKHPKDFALLQVTQESGVSIVRMATGAQAAAAIESEIEIRK